MDAIKNGENVAIFPEESGKGYFAELTHFHPGFLLLAEQCYKKGIDLPIYVAYYRKSDRRYIFDKPIKYSELLDKYKTREEIADKLRLRCNELGKMEITDK